ncbi:1-deoxy-D-xylulose-5-phosphate synthase [Streptomonospora nanhaiensis]|uniref:1-deoxy-D-xylulose-5-phosphate synthase n=1 Tax=Streptomonospora nanhaiensis TaxID=1323731 RepID=A0A853BH52_9ACTN|nr:1-deoxy-D-xylulose-5-phosphate synthase [Streptomonospora nanhaiensis]MBV2366579.1 1-deoxy-D-xylulose-5-phosphate synthase [Streptomonospora nanhaiensis]MBV2367041.1 1-deoxy-D-xylulose-5-phosphate synthase [Streptomonospora nanhaiensis]MBX9388582.1 1-deoxy-D-xylulose-5-phosphate synthase [Streptomonospora nanhaiensis]NYI93866.1 1-deoxy-D-xylulose-5-phosphate synthase [Streptomonospora nanhaiensis]
MTLLDSLRNPDDLKKLPAERLPQLAAEIREFLVTEVTRTGGHLGPNLGVVELTIALHRVFDSPRDPVLFDTGHQSYVHKLLTGRKDFSGLRSRGGLSGYPSRAESEHDFIENSHASTVLSYADGLAKANEVQGRRDRTVAAVVGDGALTGGMAWEALNNIAARHDRRVVIVVNDNGRSYSPTMGGLADHLASLRMTQGYEQALDLAKAALNRAPVVGQPLYEALHGLKKGIKDAIQPQMMFEDLGLKYVGPIDGHDAAVVEKALRRARDFGGPVIVHCITQKGKGHAPAENHEEDQFHSIGAAKAAPAGAAASAPAPQKWTSVFSEEMVALGAEREDIVAITAAMLHPTGLAPFAEAYPDRCFDVGIAEQHAATSATGLAMGGLHPVVAVYATFLNRCFDQVLMDAALHRQGVTFCLDRSGVTGPDGASHHGMWDLSILQVVPGLRLAVPRDAPRLREQLREAVAVEDAPTVVRYPTGAVAPEIEAVERVGGMDVLRRPTRANHSEDLLLIAVGPMAQTCCEVADRMADQGIGVTVIDPRWVKPLDEAIVGEAARHRVVAVVEDNGRVGAVGDAVARTLRDADLDIPVRTFGIEQEFLEHAKRADILEDMGLTPQSLARKLTETVSRHADRAVGRAAAAKP